MKKFLIATAALMALSMPTYAGINICNSGSDSGCEISNAFPIRVADPNVSGLPTRVDFSPNPGIVFALFASDSPLTFTDAEGGGVGGGGQGFKNIDVTFNFGKFSFTGIVFQVQMENPSDTFEIKSSLRGLDQVESVSSNGVFQFSMNDDAGGWFDDLNLVAGGDGFFKVEHFEVSGLRAISVPELSTWVMALIGFGLMAVFGWRKGRQERRYVQTF